MKVNMPLVTLLSGAALGIGVLIASSLSPSSTAAAASGTSATSPPSPAFTFTAPAASSTAPSTPPTTASATAPTSAPAVTPTSASAATTAPATGSTSSSNVPPQADYVAQVDGGGAAVAISVHKGKAVAYICNGHAVAAWYHGTAAHGKLNLTGKNGATLSVNYGSAGATGSITASGVHYHFSARMVHGVLRTGHHPPGLYEATATVHGVKVKAGWIVLPDGSQVGSVEYFPDSDIPPTAQAPLLNIVTDTASYDGVTLVASLISGLTGSGF